MNDTDLAESIARIRAARAAVGRAPYVENETVYVLLAAMSDANARRDAAPAPAAEEAGVEEDEPRRRPKRPEPMAHYSTRAQT
jgi:hypothetical protein